MTVRLIEISHEHKLMRRGNGGLSICMFEGPLRMALIGHDSHMLYAFTYLNLDTMTMSLSTVSSGLEEHLVV